MIIQKQKKIIDILKWGTNLLKECGIDSSSLDAQILLSYVLGLKRLELCLNFKQTMSENDFNNYKNLIEKRGERIPVAYLIGKKEFMGLSFFVNEDVLIPRPETEILVETVLRKRTEYRVQRTEINKRTDGRKRTENRVQRTDGSKSTEYRGQRTEMDKRTDTQEDVIVDLGAGCGNIAVSLAKFIPSVKIYAVDISKKALRIAEKNAQQHIVEKKIIFIQGDLFAPLDKLDIRNKVDFIVSNPPYIRKDDLKNLQPEVSFEPRLALDGGTDGLDFYRKIIPEFYDYLKEGGYLFLEIPDGGYSLIKEIVNELKKNLNTEIIKDYAGIDRIIVIQKLTTKTSLQFCYQK